MIAQTIAIGSFSAVYSVALPGWKVALLPVRGSRVVVYSPAAPRRSTRRRWALAARKGWAHAPRCENPQLGEGRTLGAALRDLATMLRAVRP